MLLTEYNEDEVRELFRKEGYEEGYEEGYKEGFEEGYKEGFEEGYKEGFEEVLIEMVKDHGLSEKTAAKHLGISIDEFRARMPRAEAQATKEPLNNSHISQIAIS